MFTFAFCVDGVCLCMFVFVHVCVYTYIAQLLNFKALPSASKIVRALFIRVSIVLYYENYFWSID